LQLLVLKFIACVCMGVITEYRKPVVSALSVENWVHASEFVPGQMWMGLGKSLTYL